MMLPIAILAGGIATRLRPVTERIPKALVEVAGRPFIDHQLRLLRRNGIERVVVCAGHLGEMLREHVGDGAAFGLQVEWSWDGDRLLGTGGALKKALPLLGEAFLVIYGDSYLTCDFGAAQAAWQASGRQGLMTVFHNRGAFEKDNVHYADGRILAYDKGQRTPEMRHVDYGLGGFRAAAFDRIPPDTPYDLADLYKALLAADELASFEVQERFYEMGSFSGLDDTDAFLQDLLGD